MTRTSGPVASDVLFDGVHDMDCDGMNLSASDFDEHKKSEIGSADGVVEQQKQDTSAEKSLGSNTKTDLISSDWEEALWSSARTHFSSRLLLLIMGSAVGETTTNDVEVKEVTYQKGIAIFRSLLENCLSAFFSVFYYSTSQCQSKHNIGDNAEVRAKEGTKEGRYPFEYTSEAFNTSRFVPVHLVRSLFEDVIIESIYREKIPYEKEVSIENPNCKSSDMIQILDFVMKALLHKEKGFFLRFEVNLNKFTSGINDIGKRTAADIKAGNIDFKTNVSQGMKKRILKSKDAPTLPSKERLEVEHFLYGLDGIHDASISFSKDTHLNGHTPENSVKHHQDQDQEEEIHLKEVFEIYLTDQLQLKEIRNNWLTRFTRNILLKDVFKHMHEDKTDHLSINRQKLALSLSVTYSFQYVCTFLCLSQYDEIERAMSTGKKKVKCGRAQSLLLDKTFIQSRCRIFGLFNATCLHLSDWKTTQYMVSLEMSSTSNVVVYSALRFGFRNKKEREDYLQFHELMTSQLGYFMNEINNFEKDESSDSIYVEEKKSSHFEMIFNESSTKSVSGLLLCAGHYLELGRALYNLGLTLGRNEKYSNYIIDSFNEELIEDYEQSSRIELDVYDLSVAAYRESIRTLTKAKPYLEERRRSEKNKEDTDTEVMAQIFDLSLSSDLFLSDALVAAGFCRDAKLLDHERAIPYFKEALALYSKLLGSNHKVVGNILQNLGAINYELKLWNDALKCYKRRLIILKDLQNAQERNESSDSKETCVGEEIVYTIASIAKVNKTLGLDNEALQNYADAIDKFVMVELKTNALKSKNEFLLNCLEEMRDLYMSISREVALNWNVHQLQSLSTPENNNVGHDEKVDFCKLSESERNTILCIEKCITCRTDRNQEEKEKAGTSGSNCIIIGNELIQLGVLKFKKRSYYDAELDLAKALHVVLGAPDFYDALAKDKTLEIDKELFMRLISSFDETSSSWKGHASIEILKLLGTTSNRLQKYHVSLSCFTLAMNAIKVPLKNSIQVQRKYLELNEARLQSSIGFSKMKLSQLKEAASHLRSSLRLYDKLGSYIEPGSSVGIKKGNMASGAKYDHSFEIQIKIGIGEALNFLGQTYYKKRESAKKALISFEDSMMILDSVLENFHKDRHLFHSKKFGPSSISWLTLSLCLGDSYRRAGEIYLNGEFYEDAYLSFKRSIEVLESLILDKSVCRGFDDECCINTFDERRIIKDLNKLYKLCLKLVQNRTGFEGQKQNDFSRDFTWEDLLLRLGINYGKLEEFPSAIKYLRDAETIVEKKFGTRNHIIISNILYNLGQAYEQISQHTHAMSCFVDSTNIAENVNKGDNIETVESLFHYAKLSLDYEPQKMKSPKHRKHILGCLEKCLRVRIDELGNLHVDVAFSLVALGQYHYLVRNLAESIQFYRKALSSFKIMSLPNDRNIPNILHRIGLVYMRMTTKESDERYGLNLKSAAQCFTEALSHLNKMTLIDISELQHYLDVAGNFFTLALLREVRYEYDIALEYLNHILVLTTSLNTHDEGNQVLKILARTWAKLGVIYEKQGINKNATSCFKKSLKACTLQLSFGSRPYEENENFDKILVKLQLSRVMFKEKQWLQSSKLLADCFSSVESFFGGRGLERAFLLTLMGRTDISQNGMASSFCKRALEIFSENNGEKIHPCLNGYIGLAHQLHSKLCLHQGQHLQALDHISKATEQFQSLQGQSVGMPSLVFAAETPKEKFDSFLLQSEDWKFSLLESYVLMLDLTFIVMDDINTMREHSAVIINQMAVILTNLKEETIAFQCFFSLLLYRRHKSEDNDLRLSDLLYNLGNLYLGRKDIVNAIKCHKECYRISSSTRVKTDQDIDNIRTLSKLAFELNEYNHSIAWCDVGLSVTKSQEKRIPRSNFLYLKVRESLK